MAHGLEDLAITIMKEPSTLMNTANQLGSFIFFVFTKDLIAGITDEKMNLVQVKDLDLKMI